MATTPTYSVDQRNILAANQDIPSTVYKDMDDETFGYTFDNKLRNANPYRAGQKMYDPYTANKEPFPYANKMTDGLVSLASKAMSGSNNLMSNYGYTGAAGGGALGGFALGALLNKAFNMRQNSSGESGSPLGTLGAGLLGATLIGGLGAYGHYSRQNMNNGLSKTASTSLDVLINSMSSVSPKEKAALLEGVAKLSGFEKEQLSKQVRGMVGAAAGAFIMRFLLSKGLLGTAVGAIIGGAIGAGSVSTKRNALGQYYF